MLRLVLVRHGESAWNVDGRYQGHADSGLTSRGRAQASATAQFLASAYPAARLLLRSDLDRVADTARYTQEVMEVAVAVDRRLREIDVGTWSGLTGREIAVADPDRFAASQRGVDVRRGGAETFADLRSRVWAALSEVADRIGAGTVLVFTHGGPTRVAVAAALGLPAGGQQRLGSVGNASVTVLERRRQDGGWRLVAFNRQGHLAGIGARSPAPSASAGPPTDAGRPRSARS